jgi:hypothetical protein
MDEARVAVVGACAIITTMTLLSGPLVGAVDLTYPRESDHGIGNGSAAIASIDLPNRAALRTGSYGAEAYYISLQPAVVTIDSVEGRPILSYKLKIDELSYSRETVHFLSASNQGAMEISLDPDTFKRKTITRSRYNGTAKLTLRNQTGSTVLREQNLTVEVRE